MLTRQNKRQHKTAEKEKEKNYIVNYRCLNFEKRDGTYAQNFADQSDFKTQ